APHGGGAFSGKDPTKGDRSAAYASRYLAKNIVGAGLGDRGCIQLSYAIGVAKPLSIYVDTYGTARCDENALVNFLSKNVDLSPRGIRNMLRLNRAIYGPTAAYGHFGQEPTDNGHFSWERLDLVPELKPLLG
ncbi:MAG: methionine adenosyltransferase domain-containing protein, partial [Alphaproteobacteria bacterium]|nr:methionine adenosyltransferase domain-containing protein [Alphaproteobacteria bacterium]